MRCLVVQIKRIEPHPNADSLDLVYFDVDDEEKMLVTGRHYFVGGLGVYIPCGAIIPQKVAEDMWLLGKLGGPDKNVVSGVKKRGIWSNGLFYGQEHTGMRGDIEYSPAWDDSWTPGQDVSTDMGIKFITDCRDELV